MKKIYSNVEKCCKRHYSPLEKGLITLCAFLLGIVLGFILSPVKQGVAIGSNNGNEYDEKKHDEKKQIPQKASKPSVSDEELFSDIPQDKKVFWHFKK